MLMWLAQPEGQHVFECVLGLYIAFSIAHVDSGGLSRLAIFLPRA